MSVAGAGRARKRAASKVVQAAGERPEQASVAAQSSARPVAPDRTALLAWYDRHRRTLPWRAAPGEVVDPYRVWLSEIMLQQTTVTTAAPYYVKFLERWPDIHALAAAPLEDVLAVWAGLGYYARARNLHACARAVVAQHCGRFPPDPTALRALPGIGRYTAAAIAAIAFNHPVVPVDGNVERVLARIHALAEPLPGARERLRALADALGSEWRAGDFAQALMDLGATLCTPQRPACFLCPWRTFCAAAEGGQAELFPHRLPKRAGELRRGAVFFVRRSDGAVLVRTRPPQGLLGGMTELPTTPWSSEFDVARALEDAPPLGLRGRGGRAWRLLPQTVTHVFTHFPLELAVYAIEVPQRTRTPSGMRFVAADALDGAALPTVMRKVVAVASEPGEFRSSSSRRGSGRAGRRSA